MREVKVPDWLKGLPFAPEYRPTDTEFADPIAYISKIEKEASFFGICKIVPPLPKPSKKYVFNNLNKSLAKRPELGLAAKSPDVCSTSSAIFTTRQQELGQNGKSTKNAIRKQVWQSGEVYTLDQFESKAKAFSRDQLGDIKSVSPLVIESLFWEASCEKPIYIEYANDVPGSGFGEPTGPCRFLNNRRKRRTAFRRIHGGSCAKAIVDMPEVVPTLSSKKEFKHLENGNEMDGSTGWKLSNSPWNLQVFARSLGSLTRFMADDIPGVTSPMIYIGMLYSWFAWHVEDHELHSMNFLHTGSSKTWYAVPGDYAFAFEEVVRRQAYGAEVDRLASLTMLGEKTTLLSPKAIVDSGIPCCRLVQNPGEFVVTFPRAYHVGFSHGFNCGEAANFGTPKWLEVAKEAAVRRAAMNCLPMLSHQQLLYLLTMSFVSRIPRSLLPGARSSRFRDRQKDERELSVKKAFLADVLSENKLLNTVLRRSGSDRVVLWDLESLPSFSKLPELSIPSNIIQEDKISSENKNNEDLIMEMNLYMENVNDLYLDNDDLSGDFQLYSGSLACVACGVLGFPFMCLVQPSEKASIDLMQDVGVSDKDAFHSPPDANRMVDLVSDGVTENIELFGSNRPTYSVGEPHTEKKWCAAKGFLRPRIFCLEHAVEIRDMLNPKGGANVLVICHSDFKKMEAHAAVVKEEIGIPFTYKEVPLEIATQDDINLIDLAIDDDEYVECGKDWTSKLCINIRHCVKMRKSCALRLGGLVMDTDSNSNPFNFKWPLTKCRAKRNLKKDSEHIKLGKPGLREKGELVKRGADKIRNDYEIIQYSRRKLKCKDGDAIVETTPTKQIYYEASVADMKLQSSDLGVSASNDNCETPFGTDVFLSSKATYSVSLGDQNAENSVGNDTEIQHELKAVGSSENILFSSAETSACSIIIAAEDPQYSSIQKGNESLVDFAPSCCSDSVTAISEGQREEREVKKLSKNVEGDCVENQDIQGTGGNEEKEHVPNNDTIMDKSCVISPDASMELSITNTVEDMHSDGYHSLLDNGKIKNDGLIKVYQRSDAKRRRKRGRELELQLVNQNDFDGYIRSPCEGLRPRSCKHVKLGEINSSQLKENLTSKLSAKPSSSSLSRKGKKENGGSQKWNIDEQLIKGKPTSKKSARPSKSTVSRKDKKENKKGSYRCDLENCQMRFHSKKALKLHKSNKCPYKGCRKRFSSHVNTVRHHRVHNDDRPLKCPWKGCHKSFKWGWSRVEHMRLHTGERPYSCKIEGCGLTFRFISDYSRHRRKTGHYVTPPT